MERAKHLFILVADEISRDLKQLKLENLISGEKFLQSGRIIIFTLALLLTKGLHAQLPPAAKPAAPAASEQSVQSDPLNRLTPRDSVYQFLQACQTGNYLRASDYLNLSQLPPKNRRRQGMELALQLDDLLNKYSDFDVNRLSDSPEGNLKDAAKADLELVTTLDVAGKNVRIELQRVELSPGLQGWLFSPATVADIPSIHAIVGESAVEKRLPELLVKTTFMSTALWQWIALLALVLILLLSAGLLSRIATAISRRVFRKAATEIQDYGVQQLLGPVELLLGVAVYGAAVALIAPSALVRFYLSRILTLLAFMAIAWIVMRLLDILSRRLHFMADQRQQALYSSVMPLGLRVAKIVIFSIALVTTISTWGYNTSTIWATLGVGSLAVALAAQKTLENFFGGVSVIGDRPVLVGDFCRVGAMVGTVEDIGLRSTRIRTLDRTVVTVPNSQFSTMTLENFAKRDRMWFHPTLGLRFDATPAQIRNVMAAFEDILRKHPDVDAGTIPIRFTGISDYSYNIEVFAYVLTPSFDRFLEVQTELLLSMLDAMERAGTGLAVPMRELLSAAAPDAPVQISNGARDGQHKQLA